MTAPRVSILLVDDEPDILEMIACMLIEDGYQLAIAVGGVAAIDRVRAEHFDVVVTDLKMPGMDGIALAAAIKKIRPDADIIVASGFVTPESREASTRAGVCGYVSKPFTRTELRSKLRAVLAEREARVRPRVAGGG